MKDLLKLIGREIQLTDTRTGLSTKAKILDVRSSWGNLDLSVTENFWFRPSQEELETVTEVTLR